MPSKLEQLQLQFRQRLLQEKEERLVKINGDGHQKTSVKISENTTTNRQNNAATPHTPPYTPSPKSNVTSAGRVTPAVKKGTPGVDKPKPVVPMQKTSKGGSFVPNSVVSPPGNVSHVKSTAQSSSISSKPPVLNCKSTAPNGSISSKPSVLNGKSTAKPISNGKAKLSGETFKVVHTETRQKQIDSEKPKMTKKPTPDKETRARVGMSTVSGHTPEHRDTTDGRIHTFASKTRLRQETKSTPTRKEPLAMKKPSGTINSMAKSQADPNLLQCGVCGRSFAKDRIEKHTTICKQSAQKQRKVFDASKMRVKGTEAENFLRKVKRQRNEPQPKKTNWRKRHDDFITSIREAKKVQRHLAAGGKISDLPPPPPSDTSDYVPCPYCKRKFNEAAAERHIPKCKNILSNKKTRK